MQFLIFLTTLSLAESRPHNEYWWMDGEVKPRPTPIPVVSSTASGNGKTVVIEPRIYLEGPLATNAFAVYSDEILRFLTTGFFY